jgi:threonine/homoserine/homoserine lactone efflux protein
MEIGLLGAFWALSLSLVLTPGADWAYAISAGMRNRAIAPAVSGMVLGYVAITAVVAAGVGTIVASVPLMLTALTLLGSAYLLYLGIGVFLNPPVPQAKEADIASWSNWLIRGFGVSGVNPKALLLFLAILPQFTSQTATWPISGQIAALGLAHIVNCAVIYTAVSASSRVVLRTRPRVARLVSKTSGAAMITIALLLIMEQVIQFTA